MFIQSSQPFERSFNVFSWNVTDFSSLEDSHEPPVAVAVIHEDEAVSLDHICLTLHRGDKRLNGVYEIKVDGFAWNRQRRRTIIFIQVLIV